MSERPVQYFSKEYLQACKSLTPMQILQFEEDFCKLMASKQKETLFLEIPHVLLQQFKSKAEQQGISYIAQIEQLMKEWISKSEK